MGVEAWITESLGFTVLELDSYEATEWHQARFNLLRHDDSAEDPNPGTNRGYLDVFLWVLHKRYSVIRGPVHLPSITLTMQRSRCMSGYHPKPQAVQFQGRCLMMGPRALKPKTVEGPRRRVLWFGVCENLRQ